MTSTQGLGSTGMRWSAYELIYTKVHSFVFALMVLGTVLSFMGTITLYAGYLVTYREKFFGLDTGWKIPVVSSMFRDWPLAGSLVAGSGSLLLSMGTSASSCMVLMLAIHECQMVHQHECKSEEISQAADAQTLTEEKSASEKLLTADVSCSHSDRMEAAVHNICSKVGLMVCLSITSGVGMWCVIGSSNEFGLQALQWVHNAATLLYISSSVAVLHVGARLFGQFSECKKLLREREGGGVLIGRTPAYLPLLLATAIRFSVVALTVLCISASMACLCIQAADRHHAWWWALEAWLALSEMFLLIFGCIGFGCLAVLFFLEA